MKYRDTRKLVSIFTEGRQRVTRRGLLSSAALNVILFGIPLASCRSQEFNLSQFLRLSEKLTGQENLSQEKARIYFQSLRSGLRERNADQRNRDREGQALLEARIIADWYSGQTVTADGLLCVDYTGALMWEVIGFAGPRGVPDSEPGRWELAPS